jgi:methylenetetrahydrofolate dehydrogenase (NADP+) / methenyltetrahydrofolate cyclohydrolase
MQLIEGKPLAATILAELTATIQNAATRTPPCVVFLRVGEDPASVYYVQSKQRTATQIGVDSRIEVLPVDTPECALLARIDALNNDPQVHGILVQAPLPSHMDERRVFNRVHPDKDVDGFNQVNLGRLVQEDPAAFVACTPAGIVEMIRRHAIPTEGRHVVVVGRSLIVGKPAALLFMRKAAFANATVTVCHSRSHSLAEITRQADILIAAVGRANTITGDMVKPGATVIDVGINRVTDPAAAKGYRIVGDVDFAAVAPQCAYITPVPGGVGLMTVAMLMHNTVQAWLRQHQPHAVA